MCASVLTKAGGMLTILRELPGQSRTTFLPRDRILARRDARVRETVRFAAETVPHYRELFRREGIEPNDVRTAADLERLPLLEKETVQENPERFRSAALGDAVRLRTHGSTGLPLDVWHDRASLLANIAFSERERAVERYFVGRRLRYSILHVSRTGSTPRQVRGFYDSAAFRPLHPQRHLVSVEAQAEDVVDAIERLRPAVVESYGAYLETLFRTFANRGYDLRHRPAALVYGAERMSPQGRDLIEERFRIPVLGRYNAVEALKIGFSCEERSGFHLHEDLCHVRIVRADGSNAAPGESGEVVISNLVNRGTVLLNYRLADVARIDGRACSCGRTSVLLDDIVGRVAEIVRLADGTLVHQAAIGDVVLRADEVVRSRVVQLERDRFELRLETADQAAFDRAATVVVPPLSALLRGSEVTAVRVADLTPEAGGKASPVVPLPVDGP